MKPLEEMGRFKTVVIDPPWPVSVERAQSDKLIIGNGRNPAVHQRVVVPYSTMSLEDIANLSVEFILDKDAFLFCWTTRKFLPDSFAIIDGWGCKYRFTMVWHKSKGTFIPQFPILNAEFIIVGVKGNPRFLTTKSFDVANCWPSKEPHSSKPEEFYDLLRRVTPEPRLDIFGRRRIAGFSSWGDEGT